MIHSWNPWKIKIYFYLVSAANEQDTEWRGILIKRGQVIRSLRNLQSEVSYIIHYTSDTNRSRSPSVNTVQRILEDLKVKQLIDIKVVQYGMLITINNYDYLSAMPLSKVLQLNPTEVVQPKPPKRGPALEGPDWMMEHFGFKK